MNRRALLRGFLLLPVVARFRAPPLLTLQERLILKADLALADLTTCGGRLNAEQAQRFMEIMLKHTTLLANPEEYTLV